MIYKLATWSSRIHRPPAVRSAQNLNSEKLTNVYQVGFVCIAQYHIGCFKGLYRPTHDPAFPPKDGEEKNIPNFPISALVAYNLEQHIREWDSSYLVVTFHLFLRWNKSALSCVYLQRWSLSSWLLLALPAFTSSLQSNPVVVARECEDHYIVCVCVLHWFLIDGGRKRTPWHTAVQVNTHGKWMSRMSSSLGQTWGINLIL